MIKSLSNNRRVSIVFEEMEKAVIKLSHLLNIKKSAMRVIANGNVGKRQCFLKD